MATANERLVGRVAEILNAREVVITLGQEHGIEKGMKFAILTEPLEIIDPLSGEVLDILEREKTRVEAVGVRHRITICRSYRSKPTLPLLTRPTMSEIELIRTLQGSPETLPVQKDATSRSASYAEEYVKVGDRVVRLEDDEA